MKKRMAAALIPIFIAASLAACGGNSGTGSPTANTDQVQESEAATEQTEPEDEQAESGQNESQTAPAVEEMGKLSLDTTIEETVLFEDDNIRIIAESLDFKYNSPYLHLKFENNGDKALSFVSGSIGYSGNSVNGYMVDGFYVNVDVEPGKTALEETYVNGDLLNILGIEKIKEIGIGFDIKDSDYNDYAQTGPLYIATSDADGADDGETYLKSIQNKKITNLYGYTMDHLDENDFLQNDQLKGISSCLITNKDGVQSLFLEVENVSDKVLNLRVSNIIVNGVQLVSGSWTSETINPGKKRLVSISLDDVASHAGGTKEELGITEYSTVKMDLDCLDNNMNNIFEKEATFTLSGTKETFMTGQTEVYNNNDLKVSYAKTLKDDNGGIHLLFLIENNSSKDITFDVDYDTLSINGTMTDFISYSKTLSPEVKSILNIEVSKYKLEDVKITSPEEISDIEFKLEIRDSDYNDIDNPTIQVTTK